MLTFLAILITLPVQIVTVISFAREARASRGRWRKLVWVAAACTGFSFVLSLGLAIAQIAVAGI